MMRPQVVLGDMWLATARLELGLDTRRGDWRAALVYGHGSSWRADVPGGMAPKAWAVLEW